MGSSKKGARRERPGFTPEFKAEAVRLLAERQAAGATATQVGRELGVRPDQLRAWARLHHEASGAGLAAAGQTLQQENRRLRREIATLQQEQAFVKKCGRFNRSVQQLLKHSSRCTKLQRFPWSGIQHTRDRVELTLRDL